MNIMPVCIMSKNDRKSCHLSFFILLLRERNRSDLLKGIQSWIERRY